MSVTKSFAPVREELYRRGLPVGYVERVIRELDDHRIDLVTEAQVDGGDAAAAESRAAARLGDSQHLADSLVAQYRHQRFAGRHPWLTFLVAPLPLVLATWVALMALVFGLLKLVDVWIGPIDGNTIDQMHPVLPFAMVLAFVAIVVLPPAVSSAWLSRLAYTTGCGWRWAAAATGLIALAACAFQSQFQFPIEPGTGSYTVGFGVSPLLTASQCLQMLVPLLVGAFVMIRFERKRRMPLEA